MPGERIGEERGKVAGQRVLPSKEQPPRCNYRSLQVLRLANQLHFLPGQLEGSKSEPLL